MAKDNYYNEILKLIYEYKGKQIDKKYIEKAIEILVNQYDLHDYVKDIKFEEDPEDIKFNNMELVANFDFKNYKININYSNFLKQIKLYNDFSTDLNEEAKMYLSHMVALKVIFEEIEHVNQFKKVLENKDNIDIDVETKILTMACEKMIKLKSNQIRLHNFDNSNSIVYIINLIPILIKSLKIRKNYGKYYPLSPLERFARIKTAKEQIVLFDLLNQCSLVDIAKRNLDYRLLDHYQLDKISKLLIPPTTYFLEKYGVSKKEIGKLEEDAKTLSSDKRLELGLRLTNEEYLDHLSKKLNNVNGK